MKKERFKRRIRKITAFAAAVAMAVSVMFPGEAFGNIDFGITVFAEENGYVNGFCSDYADDGVCATHTGCNGYQPAILNGSNYEIGNAGQLYWFADKVNNENATYGSANAVLTANITVNTGDVANCGGRKAEGWKDWTPIAYTSDRNCAYTGTFNGQNNTISGLYRIVTDSYSYVRNGLFGKNSGTIKNVGVINSYFKIQECTNATSCYIGGICGFNNGTIENCYNASTVSLTETNNDSKGYRDVGGVCGDNAGGTIKNCKNEGQVSLSTTSSLDMYNSVGGVCGLFLKGILGNCLNTGDVTGSLCVGGVCGYVYSASYSNEVIIINSYNTGAVIGTTYVGGVCGKTDAKLAQITNCYFDSDVYSGDAVGKNDRGTVTNTEGKSTAKFESGEVCYLLNNGTTNGSQVWYQTLKSEAYPNLDNTNKESRTVYACTPCTGVFSNTSGAEAQHSYIVDTEDSKIHICENCGDTHNAEFTANDTTDTISVCCDLGSVTLTAPTEENLTYDGTEKAATVTGKIEGFDTPKILYKEKVDTGISLFAFESNETAPINVGTYTASITYMDELDVEHTVSVEYTIKQKELTVEAGTYKVSKGYDGTKNPGTGSGEFKVNGLVTGDSVTINADSIGSYSSAEVGESNVDVEISLTYDSGNYKLKNTTVSVPAEITPRRIAPDVLVTGTYTYTGSPIIPDVIVQSGFALNGGQKKVYEKDKDYTVTATNNINAGTGKVTIKPVSGGNYTFDEQTVNFTIGKGTPTVTAPTATAITYGEALSASTLSDTNWNWVDGTAIPTVQNSGYPAKITVDDKNYDYTNIDGYDSAAHTVTRTIAVTVNQATPTITVTASPSFAITGKETTVTVTVTAKNPNNDTLTDVPTPGISYKIGDGAETPITNGSFVIPADTPNGTVVTITATTAESAQYKAKTDTKEILVSDCTHANVPAAWETDKTYHWHKCPDCGAEVGKEEHTEDSGTVTKEPTASAKGEKTFKCTECDEVLRTEEIPEINLGSVTIEPTPGNMDGAEIDMSVDELNYAVLTPEDKELIEQGVDIAVLMTVITINPETVPANDVTAIDNVMGDFELGCYIDVELFKRYSNGNPDVPVTDTNAPITISFKVPADILAQYPVSDYEYSVFCSHNGVGYPVTCSYNAATNVMSFSSTMFSTYALAVKSTTPAAVDYTITADSHVTVQTTAQAGETVIVTVEDGYKATVTNSLGAVIATITGTGSFVMPESNVTITSELINTHVHNYSTEWNMDSTSHWHECACGDKVNVAAHVSNGGIVTVRPTETTEGVRTYSCSICGYVMRTETIPTLDPDHSHSYGAEWKSDSTSHWHECDCGEKVDISNHISDGGVVTVAPTETGTGIMTYSCSICGYILRTETIPENTPVHTHNYGTAWDYDSTSHWHECSCGDRSNIGQHISNGGIVTVQPTATSTGLRVYSCSICGYVLRTETIPATGYNYPSYPTYPTYPTYPFDSSIFNVVTFTDKVNVTAETEGNTITIKWDKVEKADKYYVYQYKNGKYVKVKTTSDTSATFKNLKNGETYKFLIRYTKSGRLSPTKYSGTISVKIYYKPIPKPTATKNSIKLTWEAVPEAEKYAVYKYVDGKAVKLTETKKLSVKIGKLIPDTEYKYIVRAYVDGKWTTMLKSDIVTVKTKAE